MTPRAKIPAAVHATGNRARVRRVAPWLIAAAILLALVWRIPLDSIATSVLEGPKVALAAYVAVLVVVTLSADVFATLVSLGVTRASRPFKTIFLVRGATSLLGLIAYSLGQGAFGLYLVRSGEKAGRAVGIVFFLLAVNLGVIVAIGVAGLAAGTGTFVHWQVVALLLALAAGYVFYLSAIVVRPQFLARRAMFAPAFDAGIRGHLIAAAGRIPHVVLLVFGAWAGFRLWGVAVPFGRGMLLIPLVLLVTALPITPNGLGTVQALQVAFFAADSPGATASAREAQVLAFSLYWQAVSFLACGLVGLACVLALRSKAADIGLVEQELRNECEPP
jgi:hypothetical protein